MHEVPHPFQLNKESLHQPGTIHPQQVQFNENLGNVEAKSDEIKKVVFGLIKGNCLQLYADLANKTISVVLENEEEMDRFCAVKLQEHGIDGHAKKITHNPELDMRKVRLCRPVPGNFNSMDLRESLRKFGQIEEFYDTKPLGVENKSFIVVFISMEAKKQLLCLEYLFCGKNMLRIQDFDTSPTWYEKSAVTTGLGISNFTKRLNEFMVRDLMKTMQASFWYRPIAKNQYQMSCIIAEFSSEVQKEKVKNSKWEFDGRKLVVVDFNEHVCFVCGVRDHVVAQ